MTLSGFRFGLQLATFYEMEASFIIAIGRYSDSDWTVSNAGAREL
jgi:hypothetical protein